MASRKTVAEQDGDRGTIIDAGALRPEREQRRPSGILTVARRSRTAVSRVGAGGGRPEGWIAGFVLRRRLGRATPGLAKRPPPTAERSIPSGSAARAHEGAIVQVLCEGRKDSPI